jgi:P-type Ca2+ transporter type 2C
MKEDSTKTYFDAKLEDIYKELKFSEKGLTRDKAERRIHQYGFNEIKVESTVNPVKIFFQQFTSPLVWILIVALVISIFLGEKIDAIVIAIIIVANAALGFFQEYRAEKAIEALQKMASPKAHVLRSGQQIKINSREVVPGDILILETGDKIPADARIIENHDLKTQEAALTGESQSVSKKMTILKPKTSLADRKNMVYSTTVVTAGRGKAIVVGTGMKTEVGKIAHLIQEAHEKQTPLQKKLRDLGKYLTIAVIIVAAVVFLAGILSGQDATIMLLAAIALAVAAIPEGLPAVITISLAIGVQQMIKKNALVRKLPSVETLGSVSVICTDKTGTLTHNQMTVTKIWANNTVYDVTGAGYQAEGDFLIGKKKADRTQLAKILAIGAYCNDAKLSGDGKKREVFGDPTEAALVVSAEKAKLKVHAKRVDEIPFTSERKMMTTLHDVDGKKASFTKGSPSIILDKCDRILSNGKVTRLTRDRMKVILKENEKFASEALRVLGFAYKEHTTKKDAEKGMIFVGFQAMIDPPRKEVKNAIKRCQDAGIRVIMITGDQLLTAKAIAEELGITGDAVAGQQMKKLDLRSDIKNIGIFARVDPKDKLDIVNALKHNSHIVAMTGDGVNDAPALKRADIGISMGVSGTDVAKEASDMILTDDNFTSIVNAVQEGRGIFDNIRKFVNYLLSSNLGEIAVILLASLVGLPLPLTAIQILWVNLVTDGLPATALSFDPHAEGIMQRKPRPARESILSKDLKWDIITFGVLIGIFCLILFWLYQGSGLMKAQTIAFTSLVLFELVRLHTVRQEYKVKFFGNKWLIWAVLISIGLQLAVIYTPANVWFKTVPLNLIDWGVMILASILLAGMYYVVRWIMKKVKK